MRIVVTVFLVVLLGQSFAQNDVSRKGRIFGYWGYNRSAYSKSDIHISGQGYDLTFKKVGAADKPTSFSAEDYLKPENISKPQYNYRLGYYLTDRLSISVGMDHMKYFMWTDQRLEVDGYISKEASEQYQGTYNNELVTVPWRFFWIHHSDGLNYASVELEYNWPVWISPSKKFYVDAVGNVGAGLVVPKTYVMVLNKQEDNKFHVAGGGPNVKLGGRFTFFTNFFFDTSLKAGYTWMPNILVNGEGTAKASQNFGWVQWYTALGFSIPLNGLNKEKE